MEILRSWLFVPAARQRMLENAAAVRADAIVIDLEDAVAPAQKTAARRLARTWAPKLATARRRVFVRVNSLRSGLVRDDLLAVAGKKLAGVVVPKTESAQDLRDLDVLLREAEMEAGVRPGDIAPVPLIESARGLLRCEEIARASDRVIALSVGGEDYTAELGIERSVDGPGLQHLRATIVNVCAAYDLQPVDTPYIDFRDDAGLAADVAYARAIGIKGKYAIHPQQVPLINRGFTPSAADVAQAEKIIEAFEKSAGATSVDGRMVDAPVVARARAVIAASKRR